MVDFWMTIGRAVTNKTVLNTLLKELQPREYPIDTGLRGFMFKPADYDRARRALEKALTAAKLPVYPVSLMTLGELLYASSHRREHDTLKKMVGHMASAKIGDDQPDLVYVALGVAMVDMEVQAMFQKGQFKAAMFGGLTPQHQAMLKTVASNKQFQTLSADFCTGPWTWDCFIKGRFTAQTVPMPGSKYVWNHVHPATKKAVARFIAKDYVESFPNEKLK